LKLQPRAAFAGTVVQYVGPPTAAMLTPVPLSRNDDAPARPGGAHDGGRDAASRSAADRERALLRDIFMQAPAFMATMRGPKHVFELVNPAFQQLIGERDIVGKPLRVALPELEGQGFFELVDRVCRTGEAFVGTEVPIQLRRHAGAPPEEHIVNFVYEPLKDAEGRVTGLLVNGVDVTPQVRARQVAEEANRAKSNFLTIMSHELRTPLNAILGYAELLWMGVPEPVPEAARAQVERIRLSANHLLQLIEEVLAYSRLEAGRERLMIAPVRIEEIAHEVSAIIEPLAADKGLAFRVELPREGIEIETDPRKVRQDLLNVLGNAVKFTEHGEIVFRVEEESDALVLAVRDTGIGMSAVQLEHIYEPFWQADSRLHARVSGTGLGLPVTRDLVALLGGSMQVESAPAKGSCFRVRLPLVPPPHEVTVVG
jgi:signal transduction histidine kinase